VTVGDHFEQVAAVYESLRTTDEAPVRRIRQLLPDRPVTGLDIGCGTGRYSRLLRALLPDGSRLAASDVSATMLAKLKAGNRGRALGVAPLLSTAEELPLRAASLDLVTAFNCVHHFDLARFLTAVARVLAPGGQLFIYTRTPQQNARTIWGRYFPGFTDHEQRLHSEAALRDAVRRAGGLTVAATQTFHHRRTSTAERLQAQAEGRHYSTFSLYPPEELRASIATFLARLPSREVSWVDEHLLVVADGSRRNQVQPDRPGSPASRAIKDRGLQIGAGRAGQAPNRHLGGRTQITPLCTALRQFQHTGTSAQNGGTARGRRRGVDHSPRSVSPADVKCSGAEGACDGRPGRIGWLRHQQPRLTGEGSRRIILGRHETEIVCGDRRLHRDRPRLRGRAGPHGGAGVGLGPDRRRRAGAAARPSGRGERAADGRDRRRLGDGGRPAGAGRRSADRPGE
jgi:SAM-dependent methyltransferase